MLDYNLCIQFILRTQANHEGRHFFCQGMSCSGTPCVFHPSCFGIPDGYDGRIKRIAQDYPGLVWNM